MTHRVLAATVAAAVLALAPVTGQQLGTGEADYTAPTTPWGDPDLQGFWDTRTYTPFERPAEFGMREFMTEEEPRSGSGWACAAS